MINFSFQLDDSQIREIEDKFKSLEAGLDIIEERIAERMLAAIEELAEQELGHTKAAYLSALGREGNEISLGHSSDSDNGLAEQIEQGTEGFDMKPGLLQGAAFRVIPFKHSGADTKGKKAPAMGSQFLNLMTAYDAKKVGRAVNRAASKLPERGRLSGGLAPKLKPSHVADIFQGMSRQSTRKGTAQTQFMTFRTVSAKSNGWFYPPKQAAEFFERASQMTQTQIDEIIDTILKEAE